MTKPGIDSEKLWFVVRSNIKSEEKAMNNLRLAGFDVYLPRQRIEKWNKRTNTYRTIERPLMLRYLFLGMPQAANQRHWGFARACEGVESVLGDKGTPIAVNHNAVLALYLAEVDMVFDDTRAARIHRKEEAATRKQTLEMKYKPGTDVLVTTGPFASYPGVVEEVTKKGNIRAMLKLFGSLLSVEFEAGQLSTAA